MTLTVNVLCEWESVMYYQELVIKLTGSKSSRMLLCTFIIEVQYQWLSIYDITGFVVFDSSWNNYQCTACLQAPGIAHMTNKLKFELISESKKT